MSYMYKSFTNTVIYGHYTALDLWYKLNVKQKGILFLYQYIFFSHERHVKLLKFRRKLSRLTLEHYWKASAPKKINPVVTEVSDRH